MKIKMKCRYGEVEAEVVEEEKWVYYMPLENGKDLMPEKDLELKCFKDIMDEIRDDICELEYKDELTIEDAYRMRDMLVKFTTFEEGHEMSQSGNYLFGIKEKVKKIHLTEPVDW